MERGTKTVRVDRTSALGNPYVLDDSDDDEERGACIRAYGVLLRETLSAGKLGGLPTAERVAEIGAAAGFEGRVKGWDGLRAANALGRIRKAAGEGPVRLDCHCHPRPCHASEIARALAG